MLDRPSNEISKKQKSVAEFDLADIISIFYFWGGRDVHPTRIQSKFAVMVRSAMPTLHTKNCGVFGATAKHGR